MATRPSGGGVVAGSSAAPPKKSFFWSCFSCRMLAGSGLVAAGLWVHVGVRQSLRQKRPGNLYDIFRLVFAVGATVVQWLRLQSCRLCLLTASSLQFGSSNLTRLKVDSAFRGLYSGAIVVILDPVQPK